MEIPYIWSVLINSLHCSWWISACVFLGRGVLCQHLSFISLGKGRKSPVKMAFICTFIDYGANKFFMLLCAFCQHYYLTLAC
jgi:hypothetical protein